MARQGRWPRRLAAALVAAALAGGPGCLSFLHPVAPASKEQAATSAALPCACRNHVHVFFVHGLDPLDAANLSGVVDYVHSLGYLKTHYGQLYHTWQFRDDIRVIHHEDPDARFVLVGFSFGANMVRNICQAVKEDGVTVDLLVYLGGNTLSDCPRDKPENVTHIVNILATGCIWNGDHLDGADNMHYTDVWHFGSPSHLHTLDVLAQELPVVAAHVPYVVRHYTPPHEMGPMPRVAPATPPGERGEWDFLTPDNDGALPPQPDAPDKNLRKKPAPPPNTLTVRAPGQPG
jgi:hypothetical protein